MKNNLLTVLAIAAVSACAALATVPVAHAATLSGWGWSSNIGWVSFNCADVSACGSSNYKVSVDGTGNMSGSAWSPNVGWIKFGGLSSFPGSGANASVSTSSGSVSGWARACAGTADGKCLSMTSRTDGWDGWIELSGTNHPTGSGGSGVRYDTASGQFSGYAWGGEVIGWLSFNPNFAGITPVTCSSDCGTGMTGSLTGTCSATPQNPVAPNTLVGFTVSPSGGTAPYTYSWGGAAPVANSHYGVTYPSSGSGPSYTVQDSAGHTSQVLSCPAVVVPADQSSLDLWTTSATSVTKKTFNATLGQRIPLFWSIQGGLGECKGSVMSVPAGAVTAGNWANPKSSSLDINSNADDPLILTTRGTYRLALTCGVIDNEGDLVDDGTGNPLTVTSSDVTIIVNSSSIQEF